MQVTRARHIYRKRQVHLIQFTVSVEDLSTEEQDFRLRSYWPTLLELLAEKNIVLSMGRQGFFHKKADKNEALAQKEVVQIDFIRNAIVNTLAHK